MAQLIAIRYAAALFDIAKEKDMTDKFEEQCAMLKSLFESDKELKAVITHPAITNEQKMEIIEKSLKGIIAEDIMGLMNLLFKKHREGILEEVFAEFQNLVLKHKNIVIASLYSAVPLSGEQVEKIRKELQTRLQKQVEIQPVIDKTLIGGIRIQVDGMVIDMSVQSKIGRLRKQLLNTQLK